MKYDAARKTGEVFIFARIGDPYEGITDKAFADAMQRIGNVDEMIVYINSPGGDVTTGNTIYNLLKAHRAKKVIKVVGVAASIASIIAMAGDEIEIAKNGFFFIHEARSRFLGSMTRDMHLRTAEELGKMSEKMAETYAGRSKTKIKEIREMMGKEVLLTAEESIAAGFADRMIEEVPADALMRHAAELDKEHEGIADAIKLGIATADLDKDKKSGDSDESRQEVPPVLVSSGEPLEMSDEEVKAVRERVALKFFMAERGLREAAERDERKRSKQNV